MKKLLLLFFPTLFLTMNNSFADDDDRYRAVLLQQSGGSDNRGKVFIIDSEQGHMWIWEDKTKYTTDDGRVGFGTKTIYQGKLKPGKKPGDVVVYGGVER